MNRGSCLFNAIGNPDLRQSADPAERRGGEGEAVFPTPARSQLETVFVRLLFTDRELGRVATKGAKGRRRAATTTTIGFASPSNASRFLNPAAGVLDREEERERETRPRLVCLRVSARASARARRVSEGLPYLIKLLLRIDCQTWALGRSLQRRLSKFVVLLLGPYREAARQSRQLPATR